MWHLIKLELLRFRRLGLALAVAHLVILRMVSGFGDFFAPSGAKIALGLLVYAAAGLVFGLYQMGSYRKVNQWAYLIHRPLAPKKIFLALATSAALWFAGVLVLPQLLMTFYVDALTPAWVDLRHYALIPYLFGITLSFYLAACFISLSQSRGAFLVALLPYFFLTRLAEGMWVFLPLVAVLAWLAYLAASAFRPDLSSPPRRFLPVTARALPMQYALFWILVGITTVSYQTVVVFQEEGLSGYATHAWNDHFPDGTYLNAQYQYGADALAHGLLHETSERGRHLRKQIELAEVLEVSPRIEKFPRRGQPLFMDSGPPLVDEEHGIIWTFSHDRMLFHGRDQESGAAVGWLGLDGRGAENPFESIPLVLQRRFLASETEIFEFDPRRQELERRFQAQDGERLYDGFRGEASMLLTLTDRNLYLFDARDLEEEEGILTPTAVVALPGEISNLARIQTAELLDGYLLSFLFGTRHEGGYADARQILLEIGLDGSQEVVAERILGQGWPTLHRYRAFVISPLLEATHSLIWSKIAPARWSWTVGQDLSKREIPSAMLVWAVIAALLSAALVAWWGPSRDLDRRGRLGWTVAAFFLGVPALLSFFLLTRRRESVEAAPEGGAWLPWSRRATA